MRYTEQHNGRKEGTKLFSSVLARITVVGDIASPSKYMVGLFFPALGVGGGGGRDIFSFGLSRNFEINNNHLIALAKYRRVDSPIDPLPSAIILKSIQCVSTTQKYYTISCLCQVVLRMLVLELVRQSKYFQRARKRLLVL